MNIITLKSLFFRDSKEVYYLTDIAQGKELFDVLYDGETGSKKELTVEDKSVINVAVLKSYIKFYEKQLVHRDLKPENIIYNPYTCTATIIDLGEVKRVDRDSVVKDRDCCGTPGYDSPETRSQNLFSMKTDAFALGRVLLDTVSDKGKSNKHDVNASGYFSPQYISQYQGSFGFNNPAVIHGPLLGDTKEALDFINAHYTPLRFC